MAEIVQVPLKDINRNKYINLTEDELKIDKGVKVQAANSSQDIEYIFLYWDEDGGGKFATCKSEEGVERYFFEDAIKKSSMQIDKEDREEKQRLKKIKQQLKAEQDKIKEEKRKQKEEAKRKKSKYLNKKLKNKKKR